eukprot:4523791-Amphidinium_carterae.1
MKRFVWLKTEKYSDVRPREPMKDYQYMRDILANIIVTWITQFREMTNSRCLANLSFFRGVSVEGSKLLSMLSQRMPVDVSSKVSGTRASALMGMSYIPSAVVKIPTQSPWRTLT